MTKDNRGFAVYNRAITVGMLLATTTASAGRLAQEPPRGGWTIEETMKVARVEQVRVSPNGEQVLFAVRRALLEGDKGKYQTRLYIANADGTGEHWLTPVEYSVTAAEWSPDGRWVAFAADPPGRAEGSDLWLIAASGGTPRAVDVGGRGVANLLWSPDGSRLAFTMPARATVAQQDAGQHPDAPQVVDADVRKSQLWAIGMADGSVTGLPRAVTDDSISAHTDSLNGAPFDWSPDGSELVFGYNRSGEWWTDWRSSGVAIVNVMTGQTRPLVPSGGAVPHFSPDGRAVALLITDTPENPDKHLYVQVVPTSGGSGRRLAGTPDLRPILIGWSADGMQVYVSESWRTFSRLMAVPVDGSAGVALDPGDAVLEGFALNRSGTKIGFSRQALDSPMEAHLSRLDRWSPVQVSHANASLPSHPLPRTELTQWISADGATIEGLLTYPSAYTADKRYPLLVAVRSGSVSFRQTFVVNGMIGDFDDYYPVSELALRGYAVLQCNSRGGGLPGYGPDSQAPGFQPARKAFHDVLSGVDHVIKLGLADGTRLGIAGMSNGGLTTAWTITQTHRFKAAIIQSGLIDLASAALTNPIVAPDLGAAPWEDIRPYAENSPFSHLGKIATPTLFLVGSNDVTPRNSSLRMFRALQRRGVSTEMVIYPGGGHPVTAPKHLIDIGRRHIEWLGRYLP